MRREYDVFEKFADGSTLWRATISGRFEALRKAQELREHSDNEFFTIDVQAGKHLQPKLVGTSQRAPIKTGTIAYA